MNNFTSLTEQTHDDLAIENGGTVYREWCGVDSKLVALLGNSKEIEKLSSCLSFLVVKNSGKIPRNTAKDWVRTYFKNAHGTIANPVINFVDSCENLENFAYEISIGNISSDTTRNFSFFGAWAYAFQDQSYSSKWKMSITVVFYDATKDRVARNWPMYFGYGAVVGAAVMSNPVLDLMTKNLYRIVRAGFPFEEILQLFKEDPKFACEYALALSLLTKNIIQIKNNKLYIGFSKM